MQISLCCCCSLFTDVRTCCVLESSGSHHAHSADEATLRPISTEDRKILEKYVSLKSDGLRSDEIFSVNVPVSHSDRPLQTGHHSLRGTLQLDGLNQSLGLNVVRGVAARPFGIDADMDYIGKLF